MCLLLYLMHHIMTVKANTNFNDCNLIMLQRLLHNFHFYFMYIKTSVN